jgi:hypothetical protein
VIVIDEFASLVWDLREAISLTCGPCTRVRRATLLLSSPRLSAA